MARYVLPQPLALYWGSKLLLICTCTDVTAFALANPKLFGEREEARQMLYRQPVYCPVPGTVIVTDKAVRRGYRGLLRQPGPRPDPDPPYPQDEKAPPYFPNSLRQRVEAII